MNFINIFVQEHGQTPAFNIFESCELIAKRWELLVGGHTDQNFLSFIFSDQLEEKTDKRNIKSSAGPLNELV